MDSWIYIVIGFLGGILGGMGMGGGSLTIPLLTIFADVKQKIAQGINLVAFLPMAILALIIHTRAGLVKYRQTLLLAAIGVVFSVLSALTVSTLSNDVLRKVFGGFLVVIAIYQTIILCRHKR